MFVDLPLEEMTLAEKLEAMEKIWVNLSKTSESLPSPNWHKDVLEQRRSLVSEGKLKFLDWETALHQLREEVRANPAS